MEDHECHVHFVLEKLREVGLHIKLEKCESRGKKLFHPWALLCHQHTNYEI
jgi:hypothetical protein